MNSKPVADAVACLVNAACLHRLLCLAAVAAHLLQPMQIGCSCFLQFHVVTCTVPVQLIMHQWTEHHAAATRWALSAHLIGFPSLNDVLCVRA